MNQLLPLITNLALVIVVRQIYKSQRDRRERIIAEQILNIASQLRHSISRGENGQAMALADSFETALRLHYMKSLKTKINETKIKKTTRHFWSRRA